MRRPRLGLCGKLKGWQCPGPASHLNLTGDKEKARQRMRASSAQRHCERNCQSRLYHSVARKTQTPRNLDAPELNGSHQDAENTQKEVNHERTGGLAAPPGRRGSLWTSASGRRPGGAGAGDCGRGRGGDRRGGQARRRDAGRIGAAGAGGAAVAAWVGALAAAGGRGDGRHACRGGRVAGDIHWVWRRFACRYSGDCVRRWPPARLAASAQLGCADLCDRSGGCVWPAGSMGWPAWSGAAGDYWYHVDRIASIGGRGRRGRR